MYVVCVLVHVKSGYGPQFLEATLANARSSRLEAGNLRFDVLRREDDPDRFFLYEVYRDRKSFERHQETDHYLRWRDAVKDWMSEPRIGLKHEAVFFGNDVVA